MIHWLDVFDPSNYRSVPFGVPNKEQWPLFVLSKFALVILPLYAVRSFHTASDWLERGGISQAIPVYWRVRYLLEKVLAHAMFYIGMGIPIIGINAVLDLPRLIGFTVTNMLIHELGPIVLSKKFFSRLFPEWKRTLGVNLVVDNISLEISVFIDRLGRIMVSESPHAKVRNFIKQIRYIDTSRGTRLEVSLRRYFVPQGMAPRFVVWAEPGCGYRAFERDPGGSVGFDWGDLADYASLVYINDQGRQLSPWRNAYWTKFFNEVGGRSYVSNPFDVLRKFILVVVGTPLAFIAGNMLVHLQYGQTINLHTALFFSYGIILAFTIGGMYGASICSTLVELTVWSVNMIRRGALFRFSLSPAKWGVMVSTRRCSPYLNPDTYGSLLEDRRPAYRRIRFLLGGILMGGVCSWGLTFHYGQSLDSFIDRNLRAERTIGSDGPRLNNGVYRDYQYSRLAPAYFDKEHRLFETGDQPGEVQ